MKVKEITIKTISVITVTIGAGCRLFKLIRKSLQISITRFFIREMWVKFNL